MPFDDAIIEITGPGLVVNSPALAVIKALRDAGFIVKCEDWLDMNRGGNGTKQRSVTVKVNPLPWGG